MLSNDMFWNKIRSDETDICRCPVSVKSKVHYMGCTQVASLPSIKKRMSYIGVTNV